MFLLALVVERRGRRLEILSDEGDERLAEIGLAVVNFVFDSTGNHSFGYEGYVFNARVTKEAIFLCATNSGEVALRPCFQFLITIQTEYETKQYALIKDLSPLEVFVKTQMQEFANGKRNDKVAAAKARVEQVKQVLLSDLDSLLEREWRIESVLQATEHLATHSEGFKRTSEDLKWHHRMRSWWTTGILVGSSGALATTVVGLVVVAILI